MSTLRRIRSPLGAPRGRAGFVDPARRTSTLGAPAVPGLALRGVVVRETVPAEAVQYLNRLSDALFVFARHAARVTATAEILWQPETT